ncbi:MAG TPA: ATP-binding protein [Puia sp.]|nr:ATP-binding protein [Puia sp.]
MVKMLIIEHDAMYLDLLKYELKKNRFEYESVVVQAEFEFKAELLHFRPDIILADYNLPMFNAAAAFQVKQTVLPDIPFIIVSGAIGEENAVELIKSGVTDYVPKDKLFTLIPKIDRALDEVKSRREKLEAEKRLATERSRHQKMLARATIEGQERERAEIGKELHDNINQMLSIIKMYISLLEEDPADRHNLLPQSMQLIDTCINEIRRLSQTLIPPEFKEDGLVAAVDTLIERINMARPFSIHFHHEEKRGKDITEREQLTLYRIVQEQFNNIIKHAGATRVDVDLADSEEQVVLQITDNGRGFDPRTRPTGVGLNNMLSRVRLFDGDLQIISGRGAGCTLKVSLPKMHEMA